MKVWCCASPKHFKAEWWGGRQTIVAGDKEIDFITRTEKMLLLLWWTESQKLGHTEQMCSCFLPHVYANIKCSLFQCLPYLPMPCYAVHMCCSNQANFIASGWVDQKDPDSLFFFCLRSPFHVVICTKGRIKAALPPSQPSLFRSVKEEKLGGHARFGAEGL